MQENFIADFIRDNSSPGSPVSASTMSAQFGISPATVRKLVNNARCAHIPICSSRFGYYYSDDHEHIAKTVASMRGRIYAQESAIIGLSSLLR